MSVCFVGCGVWFFVGWGGCVVDVVVVFRFGELCCCVECDC